MGPEELVLNINKRHLHIYDRNHDKELKAKGVSSLSGWAATLDED